MSSHVTNPNNLAFSTSCLPGSVAEQKERERMAEFQRCKALKEAEATRVRIDGADQRHQDSQDAFEAHRKQMEKIRGARSKNMYTRPNNIVLP